MKEYISSIRQNSLLNSVLGMAKKVYTLLSQRRFFIFISLPLTLTLLVWLVWNQKAILLSYEWNFRLWPVLIAFCLYSLVLFITTWVWIQIIETLGGPKVSFWEHFRAFCISALGKRLPGTVWYIIWRAQIYGENGFSKRHISLASGVEASISTLSAVVVSVFFAVPIILQQWWSFWGILLILGVSIFLTQPLIINWFREKLKLDEGEIRQKNLLLWTLIYIIVRLMVGIIFFLLINSLTILPIENLPFLIGSQALVAALTTFLFFFPSNLGFTEVSLSLILSTILPSSIAVVVVIGNRIFMVFFEFLWSFIVVLRELVKNKQS